MTVIKRPVVAFRDPNQQRRDRETLNGLLDHSLDDYRKRTTAEVLAGVTPVNYAYPPGDVRRYGFSDTNTSTQNYEALTNALTVASAFYDSGAGHGAEVHLPAGVFDIDGSIDIPAYVQLYGAGRFATILRHASSGYLFRVGGPINNTRKYGCRVSDLGIYISHKDGHAFQLAETINAIISNVYAEGTLTATRSNIFITIDGGDAAAFFNFCIDCESLHFETGFQQISTGAEKVTQTTFLNCSSFGDDATFPNSVGFRNADTQGQGSVWIGGNLEEFGTAVLLENNCLAMSFYGLRCEGNAVDVEAESSAASCSFIGCFIEQQLGVTNPGSRANFIGCVNGNTILGKMENNGDAYFRGMSTGQEVFTIEGFPGDTTTRTFRLVNSSASVLFALTNQGKIARINNADPVTVTGSRGGNAALASLLTALANTGIIVDGTSA